jgi:hypothetical protein
MKNPQAKSQKPRGKNFVRIADLDVKKSVKGGVAGMPGDGKK